MGTSEVFTHQGKRWREAREAEAPFCHHSVEQCTFLGSTAQCHPSIDAQLLTCHTLVSSSFDSPSGLGMTWWFPSGDATSSCRMPMNHSAAIASSLDSRMLKLREELQLLGSLCAKASTYWSPLLPCTDPTGAGNCS